MRVSAPVLVAPGPTGQTHTHARMNYKDTKPLMSAFLKNRPVNGLCGIVLNRFYRLEIRSLMVCIWLVFSTQLVNCCPHGGRNYTCLLLPLYCTFSLTIDTLFLTRFRTYKIASPPRTKSPVKTTFRDWCL